MILTEAEARLHWCPFARSASAISVPGTGSTPMQAYTGHNRDNPDGQMPACVASSCMAWRWSGEKPLLDIDLVTSEVVKEAPRTGYCGLAGRPYFE
jgi:hypothetical protein